MASHGVVHPTIVEASLLNTTFGNCLQYCVQAHVLFMPLSYFKFIDRGRYQQCAAQRVLY